MLRFLSQRTLNEFVQEEHASVDPKRYGRVRQACEQEEKVVSGGD